MVFYMENGTEKINRNLIEMAEHIEELGCGEILLTSMDRDGTGEGYDIDSIKKTVNSFKIPVVACGGAMDIYDFEMAEKLENLSGIAAGNMFHFTENIYPRSKKKLVSKNLNFR